MAKKQAKKAVARKPAPKKPRNPKAQDATLINIDALKKRLDIQKMKIAVRDGLIEKLDKRVRASENRIGNLELKVNELLPLIQRFREMQSDIDAVALHVGLELGMSGGGSSERPESSRDEVADQKHTTEPFNPAEFDAENGDEEP